MLVGSDPSYFYPAMMVEEQSYYDKKTFYPKEDGGNLRLSKNVIKYHRITKSSIPLPPNSQLGIHIHDRTKRPGTKLSPLSLSPFLFACSEALCFNNLE